MERPSKIRLNHDSHLGTGLVYAGLGTNPYSKYLYDSSVYGDHFLLRNANTETAWQRINTAKLRGRMGIIYDGTNDYSQSQVLLNTPSATDFKSNNDELTDPTKSFSISLWINPASLPSTNGHYWQLITKRPIDSKGDPSTSYRWRFIIYHLSGVNYTYFRWGSSFTYADYTVTGAPSIGVWTHLALVYKIVNPTTLQVSIYRDGVLQSGTAGGTTDPTLLPTAEGMYITSTNLPSDTYERHIDGGIADLMLWNRAISLGEISDVADGSNYMLGGLVEPDLDTTTFLPFASSQSPSISPSPSESPSVSPTPSPSASPSASPSTPVAFNSLSGVVWDDQNLNSIRDPGEPGLENYYVYIDLDDSCTINLLDPAAITAADGTFTIFNPPPPNDIPAGTIIKIRMIPVPSGGGPTKYYSYPFLSDNCGAYYEIEATGDIENINFGLTDTPLPSPSVSPSISPSQSPSPSPTESPSVSPSQSPSVSVSPSVSPSTSPSGSISISASASPSESPSVSPSPPAPLGYFSFLAFWAGGAGAPRPDGTGNLLFPEFDMEGSGTFIPWYIPSVAEISFTPFTIVGVGTFSQFPRPVPCIPCINRSLLVTLYGWGAIDISTQFDFTPCAEELPTVEPDVVEPSRVKELKRKNKPK